MNYKDDKALGNLNKIIGPFILRRLKNEVMSELPEKIEHRIIVEMTEEQRIAYSEFLSKGKESIDNEIFSKGYNRSHIHILSVLTKLRQLCCHPSIVIPGYTGESAKMITLDSIIEESLAGNHRILLFSQFVSVLQMLKERLEDKDINCLYLDGSTKSKERLRIVDEFNGGYGDVFLISLKAGGYGLNLTGADTVIHFDPWWNPAVEDQATDRAHRIGQTKNVEVIKIITKDTIEERILKIHDRKRNIVDNVISDKNSEENFISRLSQKEIEGLFELNTN
ncbi:MAG: DEAD/DEAH box helicase [Clostridiaceae bacterium]|nr:DEAD/DEAH box helicase [Clostridiaceae bacterium]